MHQSTKHFPTQEDLSSDAQPQIQLGGGGYKDHSFGVQEPVSLLPLVNSMEREAKSHGGGPSTLTSSLYMHRCKYTSMWSMHARSLSLSMKSPKQEALMLGKDIHSKGLLEN